MCLLLAVSGHFNPSAFDPKRTFTYGCYWPPKSDDSGSFRPGHNNQLASADFIGPVRNVLRTYLS
jgi:hypothetical protein